MLQGMLADHQATNTTHTFETKHAHPARGKLIPPVIASFQ
jgi:hypothetical protein